MSCLLTKLRIGVLLFLNKNELKPEPKSKKLLGSKIYKIEIRNIDVLSEIAILSFETC